MSGGCQRARPRTVRALGLSSVRALGGSVKPNDSSISETHPSHSRFRIVDSVQCEHRAREGSASVVYMSQNSWLGCQIRLRDVDHNEHESRAGYTASEMEIWSRRGRLSTRAAVGQRQRARAYPGSGPALKRSISWDPLSNKSLHTSSQESCGSGLSARLNSPPLFDTTSLRCRSPTSTSRSP